MNQDDDIMAGTVADPSSTATPVPGSPAVSPAPPPAAAATPAGASDEHAASAAPPAPAPNGWVDSAAGWGASSSGGGWQADGSSTTAPPPAQTEAQKREERRKKSLGVDEKKRGRRLFGGLLGTLDAFKKEERQRDASDAAKRRTQIATRIQTKLRSETVISTELAAKERALRTARTEVERLENEIRAKGSAYQTRHVTMRRLSGFLFTPVAASPPAPGGAAIRGSASISKAIFDLPSPIPLGQAAKLHAVPPLFYLPKELTTEQDERLAKQKLEVDDLILREEAEWAASRSELEAAVVAAREKLVALTTEVRDLRDQKASFSPVSLTAPSSSADHEPLATATVSERDGRGDPARSEQVLTVKDEDMRDVEPTTADDGWGATRAVATGVEGEEVEY